jgi:hypothetical protein
VRIETVLRDAQDGQAFANLARAFHLPPEKVDLAVGAMLDDLIAHIQQRAQSRRPLAGLVELLGQTGYERVVEVPAQLGATHTQVLGNDALKFIAGRSASERIARTAAAAADVSEMITEYLLPVVAALLVGAMTKMTRFGLAAIINGTPGGALDAVPLSGADRMGMQLPRVSGGFGFSGSTGGGSSFAPALVTDHYLALAEDIKRTNRPLGVPDPAIAVRQVIEASLGVPGSGVAGSARGWLDLMQRWGRATLGGFLPKRR